MQAFSGSSDFVDPMSILYALDIMVIFALLGVLHQRYLQQNRSHLEEEETREVKMDRNMQFIISAWFLLSVFIPVQYRFVFWILLAPVPPIYRHRIGPLHVK
jgi:Na+/H+ antiporter NhaD/arsenite permease-like protein